MKSEEIIRSILQRYKEICAKYPQSPSFIPNKKGDSFYLIRNFDTGKQPTQIRLSNHGTSLKTWVDRDELGESVERINPAFSINISIVFVDEGKNLTKDCIGQQNCENCQIVPCIPETFEGQDELGRAFTVTQYAYRSKYIRERYINGITKAIAEASVNGKYVDPLIALYRAAKEKTFHSSTQNQASNNQEIKENRKMNKKQVIRLNENQLKQIVMESVKRVLKESESYSDSSYRYIDKPIKWEKPRVLPYKNRYGEINAYNVDNLLNKRNDIVGWFAFATDMFAGVTNDGSIYLDYKPETSVGNIKTDVFYGTMDNGSNGSFLGEEAIIIKHTDGSMTLVNGMEDICHGYVEKRGEDYVFVEKR